MMIMTRAGQPGVKLYTIGEGQVVSPVEGSHRGETYMVLVTEDRRLGDRYAGAINVVNLASGVVGTLHGSSRVIHHRSAAVVLDYIEG